MDEVSPFEPTVLSAVARHWRLVLGTVIAVVIPLGLYAVSRPASYGASASLTVSDPRGQGVLNGQTPTDPTRYVADQLAVFDSTAFGARAAVRGLQQHPPLKQPAGWFVGHTSAGAAAADSNLISVSFKAPSAQQATSGVRAAVAAYGDVVRAGIIRQANAIGRQLDASLQTLDAQLATLRGTPADPAVTAEIQQLNTSRATIAARRSQVSSEAALPATGIGQLLLSGAATSSGKSGALRLVVLAIVLGLLIGTALAYVRSYRRRVFVHQRDPELVLHAPLLIDASVLSNPELLGLTSEPDAPRVEGVAREMFAIGASLVIDQRASHDRRGLSLAVVSAHGGANCSAVTWRTAFAFASQGLRVVLIDVHGSRPPARAWMTRIADDLVWEERADGQLGLSHPRTARAAAGQLLAGEPTSEPTKFSPPPRRALYYCGEPPPVHSQTALAGAFRALEDDFDIVLINAPFFLPSADAAYLAAAAGTVLVVVPDGGSVPDHEELARRLDLAAATAIGYVYCSPETEAARSHPEPPSSDTSERPKLTARARAS